MKIKVFEEVRVEKEIEITFPYYFKWDISGDAHNTYVYGMVISPKNEFVIYEMERYSGPKQIKYEVFNDVPDASCYKLNCVSNKEEFESARKRAIDFINQIQFTENADEKHE